MSARRVLIIGGTGFLGRRITEHFVSLGDRVSVLSRGERASDWRGDIELISADRHSGAAFESSLHARSFDVVVDNVAFNETDVTTILSALHEGIGHYLLTSSSAVYASMQVRRPLREADADLSVRLAVGAPDPFHPRLGQAYGNGKRAAEQALLESRVPWTVIRPPVVVGPDDRTLRIWWLVQRILDGEPLLIPDWGPGRLFQVVWTRDVARALGLAAGNPRAFGQAFNIAEAEIFTAETWCLAAGAALGKTVECVHVPEADLAPLGVRGYSFPIAGRSLGHILLDLGAARCQLEFEPAPENTWLSDTIAGCADNPPSAPSAGYEKRLEEIAAIRRLTTERQAVSWMVSETRA